MKVNIEKIKEFVRLGEELRAEGVMNSYFGDHKMNVGRKNILKLDNIQLKKSNSVTDFPYELSVKMDDIELYAIAKLEHVKELPQFKEIVRADLLKQLAALENDGEVTA
jgi:hypothetical protein